MTEKPKLIFADINEFSAENTLYKVAKKHDAKDFVITGKGIDMCNGIEASIFIIISETIGEEQATKMLNETWRQGPLSEAKMKIFAWIPLNDMKDMMVANIEKNTEMRMRMFTLALEKISAYKYIRHNTDMEFAKDIWQQLQKQKKEANA